MTLLSRADLLYALQDVEKAGSKATNKADQDYLSGVEATLNWLLHGYDSPLEDYKDLINE